MTNLLLWLLRYVATLKFPRYLKKCIHGLRNVKILFVVLANVALQQRRIQNTVNLRWSFFFKIVSHNCEKSLKTVTYLCKKLLLRGLTWFQMFCLIKNYGCCSLINFFKKLQLIRLKENDSKTFSQPNFYSFNGKKCLRFLRNCFYQKLLAVLKHS